MQKWGDFVAEGRENEGCGFLLKNPSLYFFPFLTDFFL